MTAAAIQTGLLSPGCLLDWRGDCPSGHGKERRGGGCSQMLLQRWGSEVARALALHAATLDEHV